MQTEAAVRGKTYDMVYIGIFTVLIAVCSWISIPAAVPFTLQTFGVFMAVEVLDVYKRQLDHCAAACLQD